MKTVHLSRQTVHLLSTKKPQYIGLRPRVHLFSHYLLYYFAFYFSFLFFIKSNGENKWTSGHKIYKSFFSPCLTEMISISIKGKKCIKI